MGYSHPHIAMIVDLETFFIYKFQFVPESITDSKSANYADYGILGRSSPLKGYQNSPSRTLEFTVRQFANPTVDGPPMPPALIKLQTDFLLSLPYPDYSGGGIKPPHRCLIIFGGNIQMIGVCTNASAHYKAGIPWDLGPGLTHGVEVSLSFAEVKDVPLDTIERRFGAF